MISVGELEVFRQTLQSAIERHQGAGLDEALAGAGWHDALAVDARAAVSVLFELQGFANATSSALAHVMASGVGLDADDALGLVLPASGGWEPPGQVIGDRLVVRGLCLASAGNREAVAVVARSGDRILVVTADTAALTMRAIAGMDPASGLIEVAGETPLAGSSEEAIGWETALALGRLAIGHEIVGAARTMLALAREHALDRVQFGKPIATFQAVRHRLADTLVAIESADAMLVAAWEDRSQETARLAKALAGQGGRTAARHCQQVLAGIGFTEEHPFHRYLRRVLVLDQLLGGARALTNELGSSLLQARALPALLPL